MNRMIKGSTHILASKEKTKGIVSRQGIGQMRDDTHKLTNKDRVRSADSEWAKKE